MDRQYRFSHYKESLREHDYGKNVKLLDDPYLLSLVSKMSDDSTKYDYINRLLSRAYRYMLGPVLNAHIPNEVLSLKTRMYSQNKKAICNSKTFKENSKFVITNMLRAGMIPSMAIFEELQLIFKLPNLRMDNIFISRTTSKAGKVKGANIAGAKVGSSVEDSYLLIPDPMGATGSSIIKVLNFYKMMEGTPKKIIIMGLIITPEYLKNVRRHFPEVLIYSARLDRGLSPADVLNDIPGKHWNREKGLNAKGYIIPGAGGLGEIISNTTF